MNVSRISIVAVLASLLAPITVAQQRTAKPAPITTDVKDAGIYHLATGTWTRGLTGSALAGPEVIYDNTCTVGYYYGMLSGNVMWDSGRIPSTSSPNNANSLTGLYDNYRVNGFQFGYCSFEPLVTNIDIAFTDCYAACDKGGNLPDPIEVFHLINVPAGTASGAQGCWILTLNLSNTTRMFDLGGDCNGVFNNTASTDSFGWSWSQAIPTTGSDAGPIMGGDPAGLHPQSGQSCGGIGGGTTFVGASNGPGSGIGILDQYEIGNGPSTPGCYWFGGYSNVNPFGAFYLQLQGEQAVPPPANTGSPYCPGVLCPCGNDGNGDAGCANSSGYGARLSATGNAVMGANDTLQFHVNGVNGAKPGLLLRGNNQISNPVGAGLICTGGGSMRSQVVVSSVMGIAHFADWTGLGFGSVANSGVPTNFQYWYRDPMGSPCIGTDFNFSNAWTVTY